MDELKLSCPAACPPATSDVQTTTKARPKGGFLLFLVHLRSWPFVDSLMVCWSFCWSLGGVPEEETNTWP